jgi:hypothetical protein
VRGAAIVVHREQLGCVRGGRARGQVPCLVRRGVDADWRKLVRVFRKLDDVQLRAARVGRAARGEIGWVCGIAGLR